ncbi:MAG: hypothetical protein V4537_00150 [Pseudomonadota bacterium]
MARRVALIVGAVTAMLVANLLIFGEGTDRSVERERRKYRDVTSRATQPILRATSRNDADALATCLSNDPTGRLRMTALSRGVRDATRAVRYDRVVLHEPMAVLVGITARSDGGAEIVVLGRPGRALHDRERATIAACL